MFTRRLLCPALLMIASTSMAAPMAHMVFFTLADPSDASSDTLIAACHKHLADHDGVTHFSVGARAKDQARPVNDQSFHVALHVIFDSRESHDTYQTHPRHLAFIKEAKSLWSKVQVFDSNLVPAGVSAAPSQKKP